MGETDKNSDTSVTNDDGADDTTGSVFGGDWGDSHSYADTSSSTDAIPFVAGGKGVLTDIGKIAGGDHLEADISDISLQIVGLGASVGTMLLDPIGFLAGAGIGILIDFVQPLEDLLGLVTGNPERMTGEQAKWTRVRTAMDPLAAKVRTVGSSDLTGWDVDAATVARQRIDEFAGAVEHVRNQITRIEAVLELAKALATVAQDLIKTEIGSFVSKQVIEWAVATAAAAPTFGASMGAFVANCLMQYSITMMRVVRYMREGAKIFQLILKVVTELKTLVAEMGNAFKVIKVLPGLMTRTSDATGDTGTHGATTVAMQ